MGFSEKTDLSENLWFGEPRWWFNEPEEDLGRKELWIDLSNSIMDMEKCVDEFGRTQR